MSMPNNLVLVRHGQSAGNVAVDMEKNGDLSAFTDAYITTPGHQWRLSDLGRQQAPVAGAFIRSTMSPFDKFFCSPFVRAKETAGRLGLPDAHWRKNRALRERDWGDIGCLPRTEFEARAEYLLNAKMKSHDPLYWVPPGGESIAHVAENRVRNVCDTMHRECSEMNVIVVGHGELFWAFRLVLERLDDADFIRLDNDRTEKIFNCAVLHYTRLDPVTGEQAPRLQWLQVSYPVCVDGVWSMNVGEWHEFEPCTFTNEDLLAEVADIAQLVG